MKVIDSFAWFEYFFGTPKGKRIEALLERSEELGTPATVLTEIMRKLRREKKKYEHHISFIVTKSKILPVSKEVAIRAGLIDKLHFSDALILATAQQEGATLITGDLDFKGQKDVEML